MYKKRKLQFSSKVQAIHLPHWESNFRVVQRVDQIFVLAPDVYAFCCLALTRHHQPHPQQAKNQGFWGHSHQSLVFPFSYANSAAAASPQNSHCFVAVADSLVLDQGVWQSFVSVQRFYFYFCALITLWLAPQKSFLLPKCLQDAVRRPICVVRHSIIVDLNVLVVVVLEKKV